ncbi:MAG: hypothetical protein ACKVOQ_04275 [Cyclobacteriaceae bacterium]
MKTYKLLLILITVSTLLSCAPEKSKDTTFSEFISHFPTRNELLKFPQKSYEKGLLLIDTLSLKKFVPLKELSKPISLTSATYYHSAFKLYDSIYSVVIYQEVADGGYSTYQLLNYNKKGSLLSSKCLAYDMLGITYYTLASVREGLKFSFTESVSTETSKDDDPKHYSIKLTPEGKFLPTDVPPEALTDYVHAINYHGETFVYKTCNGMDEFHIVQSGDSIQCISYAEDDLDVLEIKKNSSGISYTLKAPSEKLSESFELCISRTGSGPFNSFMKSDPRSSASNEEYLIESKKKTNFPVRQEVCITEQNAVYDIGFGNIHLDDKIEGALKEALTQGFTMKTDTTKGPEEDTILSSLFDQNGALIAQLAQDKTFVSRIYIFSNTFLTYARISVGSSLSDLLKAYPNAAIITGERGVAISSPSLEGISFILDSKITLDQNINELSKDLKVVEIYIY